RPIYSGRVRFASSLLAVAVAAGRTLADRVDDANLPPPATAKVNFTRDVQPILAKHCYACHGPDKQEGDLRWDVKAAALRGSTSGPAIVPGHSAESRMIRLVAGLENNLVMPKKGARLTPE